MGSDDWIENVFACSVCGASEFQTLRTPERWIGRQVFDRVRGLIGLARCKRCGFTFVNPRPSRALLDEFYTSSDYTCHESNDTTETQLKADFLLDIVDSLQPVKQRMLDYGCGGGLLLRRALQRGVDALGFDVGQHALRTCLEQRLPVTSRLDDLSSGAFDCIVLHHVFEHVSDHAHVLREVAGLLSRNGKLFIEVPNAASLRARLSHPLLSRRLKFDERFRAYPIHLSYFVPSTLTRLLEHSGFSVQHLETYGLGVDELVVDEAAGNDAYAEGFSEVKQLRTSLSPRVRELVKQALFRAELGENLLVVASPGVRVGTRNRGVLAFKPSSAPFSN